MPRAKQSSWVPKGIELWEIDPLYDEVARGELIGLHLGCESASAEKRHQLLDRTLGAAALLNVNLHLISKPLASEQRVAIAAVLAAAEKLADALKELDPTSFDLLASAADRDEEMSKRSGQTPRMQLPCVLDGKPVFFGSSLGGDRMNDASRAVDDLRRWSVAAMPEVLKRRKLQNSRPEPNRAGKRAEAICDAIANLEGIWKDAWRRDGSPEPNATPSTLLPFARAALNPVLADHGEELDLRKSVETVLYGAPRVAHH